MVKMQLPTRPWEYWMFWCSEIMSLTHLSVGDINNTWYTKRGHKCEDWKVLPNIWTSVSMIKFGTRMIDVIPFKDGLMARIIYHTEI